MSDVKDKKLRLLACHCRAARGMLNMTQRQLSEAAGVDEQTIRRFEKGEQHPHPTTLDKIKEAFERRGIEFTNGGSPGVRLRPENQIIH
jgi:transcriptional regulator with XRE-family HTH domain